MPIRRFLSGSHYFAGLYLQAPQGPNNEQGRNAARKDDVAKFLNREFFGSRNLGETAYKFFNQVGKDRQNSNVEFTEWGWEVPPGALAPTMGEFKNGVLIKYISQREAVTAARRYEQENGFSAHLNSFLKEFGAMMRHSRETA